MAKLTYEDKKEIIRLYDKEHHGPRYIAELFNVNKSSVVNVINKYRIHGENILQKQKNLWQLNLILV